MGFRLGEVAPVPGEVLPCPGCDSPTHELVLASGSVCFRCQDQAWRSRPLLSEQEREPGRKQGDQAFMSANVVEKRRCKHCGVIFEITQDDVDYYETNGWTRPSRCKPCRAHRRDLGYNTRTENPYRDETRR